MYYETFEEMFNFYRRRNIFNQHDSKLVSQEIVHDNDTFWKLIVEPKVFQGRLSHGDAIRISAILA